jgi:hypothetical protein
VAEVLPVVRIESVVDAVHGDRRFGPAGVTNFEGIVAAAEAMTHEPVPTEDLVVRSSERDCVAPLELGQHQVPHGWRRRVNDLHRGPVPAGIDIPCVVEQYRGMTVGEEVRERRPPRPTGPATREASQSPHRERAKAPAPPAAARHATACIESSRPSFRGRTCRARPAPEHGRPRDGAPDRPSQSSHSHHQGDPLPCPC